MVEPDLPRLFRIEVDTINTSFLSQFLLSIISFVSE